MSKAKKLAVPRLELPSEQEEEVRTSLPSLQRVTCPCAAVHPANVRIPTRLVLRPTPASVGGMRGRRPGMRPRLPSSRDLQRLFWRESQASEV